MELVQQVYRLSTGFPKDELYALTSQMRRCAVSIPSNIAEGYGRHSTSDYVRFLRIAMGSLYELRTQLGIAAALGYTAQNQSDRATQAATEIACMLGTMVKKLENSLKP